MKLITLQATGKHPRRKTGERYEADRKQAMIDLASRHAEAPKTIIRQKRRYRRRDMQAES